jgi:leukotriene-A4 hydrolase
VDESGAGTYFRVMKGISVILLLPLVLFTWTGCGQHEEGKRSKRIQQMIAQSKLARDPHTWSKPNEARVTRLHWDADVDMTAHVIHATATYQVSNLTGAPEVILDMRDLTIHEVAVNGVPVVYRTSEPKDFIGAPLIIPIPKDSCEVSVRYSTSPDAGALLWVEGESPFLFSQSQAILARTWIPCQDSPGVRFTYTADVRVPKGLIALMSAENPQSASESGAYSFRMDQPIPSYLLALAVGNLEFRTIGPRTGVYALAEVVDAAAREFEDVEAMITAAEKLYGPYAWGRYDLLVLPAAFPFGGMENPRLTFATPTILAGDKSLVSLVAHELAHSWSGNLVTNSTWNDFWLNEGFTVYFELRIMEEVFGKESSEMLALLNRQDLDESLASIAPGDSHLRLQLENRDPDDGMTDIAYNKGYFFLRAIEDLTGRERFDAFLRSYFATHAFRVMDTDQFLSYLKTNLLSEEEYAAIRVGEWIDGPGLPGNAPEVQSPRMAEVDRLAAEWKSAADNAMIPWTAWSYQEKYRFLSSLKGLSADKMKMLDEAFSLTQSTNSEVLFKWLQLSILNRYTPAYPRAESFLAEVGRRKFVMPLYEAMVESGQKEMAKTVYARCRPAYHSVTAQSVDALLAEAE